MPNGMKEKNYSRIIRLFIIHEQSKLNNSIRRNISKINEINTSILSQVWLSTLPTIAIDAVCASLSVIH